MVVPLSENSGGPRRTGVLLSPLFILDTSKTFTIDPSSSISLFATKKYVLAMQTSVNYRSCSYSILDLITVITLLTAPQALFKALDTY